MCRTCSRAPPCPGGLTSEDLARGQGRRALTSAASHSQARAVYKLQSGRSLTEARHRTVVAWRLGGRSAATGYKQEEECYTFCFLSAFFFLRTVRKELPVSQSSFGREFCVFLPSRFMYLDLLLLSRRPTMVIMEVPTIDCASLRALLERAVPGCLLLDCRSFLSFNSSHISGSSNVRFSTIVRRRARGGLGLEHIVPNEDTRNRLLSGDYQSVVLLDDRSLDLSQAKKDGTLMLAVGALCRDPSGASVFILKGGFDKFSTEYPEMCTKPSPPQGLSLPLSSSHPGSADPSCSPCNTPLYDQGGPVEILPFLYLGSAYHASRKDMLDMLGITALINVSANCPNHFEDSFLYKSIPVEDNHKADISSWFNEAIDFIDSVRNKGGRVFVHCQAGISRSATICLAYLMRTNRVKLDEAFEFVKQRRSIISPNFSFMGQLLQFESQVLASSTCSSEAGSPAIGKSTTVFNFPVSIPVHTSAGQLSFLHSPITTSPSC